MQTLKVQLKTGWTIYSSVWYFTRSLNRSFNKKWLTDSVSHSNGHLLNVFIWIYFDLKYSRFLLCTVSVAGWRHSLRKHLNHAKNILLKISVFTKWMSMMNEEVTAFWKTWRFQSLGLPFISWNVTHCTAAICCANDKWWQMTISHQQCRHNTHKPANRLVHLFIAND